MDLTATGFGNLLNPKTKHQVKVTNLMQKIFDVANFIKDSSVPNKKLVIDEYDRVVVSSLPNKVIPSMNISHPIVKILIDDIDRITLSGDDSKYYMFLVSKIVNQVVELISQGICPKALSQVLRNIRDRIIEYVSAVPRKNVIDEFNAGECIREMIKDTETMNLSSPAKSEFPSSGSNGESLKSNCNSLSFIKDKKIGQLISESYNITGIPENIRIFKSCGGCLQESYVTRGLVIGKLAEGAIKEKKDCYTAIYNCPIDISSTETKGCVLFENADQMLNFAKNEEEIIAKFVEDVQADVIFCNGSVSNLYLDFLNSRGILVFKIHSKFDLMRIRELCGGSVSQRLCHMGKEHLGRLKNIETLCESGKWITKFVGHNDKMATIVLKDPLLANCDEYERLIENHLRVLKDKKAESLDSDLVINAALEAINSFKKESEDQEIFVCEKIEKVFLKSPETCRVYNSIVNSIKYSFDLVILLLMTDDYLISQEPSLNIAPKSRKGWDEDD